MTKKTLFSLLLFCIPLLSLCSSKDSDPEPEPTPGKKWLAPIRVATYNIQYDNPGDAYGISTTRIRRSVTE